MKLKLQNINLLKFMFSSKNGSTGQIRLCLYSYSGPFGHFVGG